MQQDIKHTYIHELTTLQASNGELYLCTDTDTIVLNIRNLIDDLPHILDMCIKEHNNQNKLIKEQLKETIKLL